MNRIFNPNRTMIALGVTLSLFIVLTLIMTSSKVGVSNTLDIAITADLLITIPLIYFLLIRKTSVPKTTVVPIMILGLILGSYMLPESSQTYLAVFKTWALPVIEISILVFVVYKVRKAVKSYRRMKDASLDVYTSLKNTCYEILPKAIVVPFATEIAVLYYGFINWRTRTLQDNEFSYHKNSGTPTLLIALVFLIAIETVAIHLLVMRWNVVVAWILSGLSIYTAIQVIGFAKSLSQRPISINQDTLSLRYGILNEVDISISDIDTLVISKKPIEKNKTTRTLSLLGDLESHNMILTLKNQYQLVGLYGIKRPFKVLAFHIDDPKDFEDKMKQKLSEYSI